MSDNDADEEHLSTSSSDDSQSNTNNNNNANSSDEEEEHQPNTEPLWICGCNAHNHSLACIRIACQGSRDHPERGTRPNAAPDVKPDDAQDSYDEWIAKGGTIDMWGTDEDRTIESSTTSEGEGSGGGDGDGTGNGNGNGNEN